MNYIFYLWEAYSLFKLFFLLMRPLVPFAPSALPPFVLEDEMLFAFLLPKGFPVFGDGTKHFMSSEPKQLTRVGQRGTNGTDWRLGRRGRA